MIAIPSPIKGIDTSPMVIYLYSKFSCMKSLSFCDLRRAVSHNTKLISYVVLALLFSLVSCGGDDDEPAKAQECLVVRQTNIFNGRESATLTYTAVSSFTNTYDDRGNETSSTVNYDYEYSDGSTADYRGTNSYQYDKDDFLLRQVSQVNRRERDNTTSFSEYNTVYSYENGRLSKSTGETRYDDGTSYTSLYTYEYDAQGRLIKFTNVNGNETTTIKYNGDAIQEITIVDNKGASRSPFFEYNSKGLLTKWIETRSSYTEEYRFEYDGEGQIVRQERYIDGKPNHASTSEYDNKKSPYLTQSGRAKGHPYVPSYYPDVIQRHNLTRGMYYDANAAGDGWVLSASTIYVYDYNGNDYPVTATSKNFDMNGAETSTLTSTYEYQGCP
jgi:YD repeat-containing protein